MRSKLQAQCPSLAISSLRILSLAILSRAITRLKFRQPPNRSLKRSPLATNPQTLPSSPASQSLGKKASVDADAASEVDAAEGDGVASKPSPRPSVPPPPKALSPTCQFNKSTKGPRKSPKRPNPKPTSRRNHPMFP